MSWKFGFDLLFTDIALGEDIRGGLAAGQEVAKLRPGLPVPYTTGQGITHEMIALFVPASWFLAKPSSPRFLTLSTAATHRHAKCKKEVARFCAMPL
jgi:hypothetical protein